MDCALRIWPRGLEGAKVHEEINQTEKQTNRTTDQPKK